MPQISCIQFNPAIGDLYQVVTYMHCSAANNGGFIYPTEKIEENVTYQLKGFGGFMHLFPIHVPQLATSFTAFIDEMKKAENVMVNDIEGILQKVKC